MTKEQNEAEKLLNPPFTLEILPNYTLIYDKFDSVLCALMMSTLPEQEAIFNVLNAHDRLVEALEVTLAILEDASMIDSDDYKKSLEAYNEAKGEK